MSVIEVRGRGGQLLGRLRIDKPEVSIGRAFSNDLILDDLYVSPHHLKLVVVDGGWEAHDLASLNGVRHRSGTSETGAGGAAGAPVRSGDTLRIGHTVLRVYSDDHPVPEALRLGGWERRLPLMGRLRIWPVLAGLTILVSSASAYWNSWVELEPRIFLEPVTVSLGGPMLFALFWALLGRLLRHRAQLLAHFGIWLLFGLLSQVTTRVAALAGYNASSALVEAVLDQGLHCLLLTGGLWCSILLATNLGARGRWLCSIGVAVAFISIGLVGQYQMHDQFLPFPRYYSRLAARAWLWAGPAKEGHLVQQVPDLADRAKEALLETEPSGLPSSAKPAAQGDGARPGP